MKNQLDKKLKELDVAIVSHIFSSGPSQELESFLSDKVKSLLFIGHPFEYRKEINSFYRFHVHKNTKLHKAIGWKLPGAFLYFKDFLYTMIWILKSNTKFDYYIGADNFDAFCGLILQKLGRVDKVIFYCIDYVPRRFQNSMLDWLYHFFDKACLTHCSVVWNVSKNMAQAREKFKGLKAENCARQIVVPLGIWHDRIPKISLEEKDKNTLIYMGHLLEKQGVDMVIRSIPCIKRKIPDIKFIIIGTGNYESSLINLVKELKLDKNVIFTGYVESHKEVERRISEGTIGMALYKPVESNYSYFADPGKIKNYLSAGLPVILTNVPPIARELVIKKCAFVVEYEEKDVCKKITNLLLDRKLLKCYSRNAIDFAKSYDWNSVFSNALIESIK